MEKFNALVMHPLIVHSSCHFYIYSHCELQRRFLWFRSTWLIAPLSLMHDGFTVARLPLNVQTVALVLRNLCRKQDQCEESKQRAQCIHRQGIGCRYNVPRLLVQGTRRRFLQQSGQCPNLVLLRHLREVTLARAYTSTRAGAAQEFAEPRRHQDIRPLPLKTRTGHAQERRAQPVSQKSNGVMTFCSGNCRSVDVSLTHHRPD